MLTASRIADIAGEINDDVDSPTWMLREGIDIAAMRVMFESVEHQLHEMIAADGAGVPARLGLRQEAARVRREVDARSWQGIVNGRAERKLIDVRFRGWRLHVAVQFLGDCYGAVGDHSWMLRALVVHEKSETGAGVS